MSKYNRTPNPKYAVTDKPELPMSSVNFVGPDGVSIGCIGREYMVARIGKEVSRVFCDDTDGNRVYLSEKQAAEWFLGRQK